MENKTVTLTKDTYTLIEQLDAGGQGVIWKVCRTDGTEWIMKSVLTIKHRKKRETFVDPHEVESNKKRLQSEIDFLVNLKDPEKHFIVPCLDFGTMNDKHYAELPTWIMPYYPQTLEQKMPPYLDPNAALPSFADYIKWLKQTAIALKTIHTIQPKESEECFIHRDIKAENMMLTEDEDIRLIDFGIVKETIEDSDTVTCAYTPSSAAPEQVLVSRYDVYKGYYAIGAYTDMYALGMVFYRLLTGEKTTVAQQKMSNPVTKKDHDVSISQGGTGALGKLGGLTDDEYSILYEQLIAALEETDNTNETVIQRQDNSLPNTSALAESFADEVRLLLHADYKKRPSATEVLNWIETLPALQEATVNGTLTTDKIERSIDNQQSTKKQWLTKKWLGIACLLLLLLGGSKFAIDVAYKQPNNIVSPTNPTSPTSTSTLTQWQTDLEGGDTNKQHAAWRALKQQSTVHQSMQAVAIITNFEQQSLALFDSKDSVKQQQAIPRLQLMADSGTKTAMQRLGNAYEEGHVVKQHWGKAWTWYRKAGAIADSDKKRLEKAADTILQGKKSPARTRQLDLAYQVAEHTAQHQPAGDPSQKWMEYRYRTGDGIAVDNARANQWQQRYEGK